MKHMPLSAFQKVASSSSSLVLPGGANITTAPGDFMVVRGYAGGVVRVVDYSPASVAPNGGGWTTYTPVLTTDGGTITSYTATGGYQRTGKTVRFRIRIAVTNNGSGSGGMRVTLPFSVGDDQSAFGREIGVLGLGLVGHVGAGTSVLFFRNADNSYPSTNGIYLLGGTMESS